MTTLTETVTTTNPSLWRNDFPVLTSTDTPPAYLDSAATTLRPRAVVDAVKWYLESGTAAVHRGVHQQSIEATDRFERTRETLATWFGADRDEIVFTSGATSAIHLVRHGLKSLKRVAVTVMEHHSNLVPWLNLDSCVIVPVDSSGQIDMAVLETALKDGIDLLAVTNQSNVLGNATPIQSLIEMAHQYGTKVLVDAAQSAAHLTIDVRKLDIDFLVCSSHKMLGPSGVGALFAARRVHSDLEPVILGGQMVDQVNTTDWTPQPPPYCYEAGSPPVESVLGWGAALEYMEGLGRENIARYLECLTGELINRLAEIPGLRIYGPTRGQLRGPLTSFSIDGIESPTVAKILSQRENVLVRAGFHCAQPLHDHLNIRPTVRASLQIYNNLDDLDRLARTLYSISKLSSL